MPFIPTPNVAQVEIVANWQSQICQNVFHYSKSSPWEVPHLQDLGAGIQNILATSFGPAVSDQLTYVGLRITDLEAQNAPSIEYTNGFPIDGDATSPSLPNNVSCVFTKRTLLRGRSYRGRFYHMGLVESQVNGNQVTSDFASVFTGYYTQLMGIELPGSTDEATMVVLSLYEDNQPRTQGLATLVTAISTDGIIDSQRRRLPGRGS